jgi:hypothetical protein
MPELGEPRLNQWYLREDTGEKFLVTDYDEETATVEIQTAEGDLDELDESLWQTLPLEFAEPPQDWAAPLDALEVDDREGMETEPDGRPTRVNGSPGCRISPVEDQAISSVGDHLIS